MFQRVLVPLWNSENEMVKTRQSVEGRKKKKKEEEEQHELHTARVNAKFPRCSWEMLTKHLELSEEDGWWVCYGSRRWKLYFGQKVDS